MGKQDLPDRSTFAQAYSQRAPWDIGRPQSVFTKHAKRANGTLLDVGCGTGENALYFAEQGCIVSGVDFLAEPIETAKAKAAKRGLDASFAVANALELDRSNQRFDTVIDCGLFHIFDDADRARYVAGLSHVTKEGGHALVHCFSTEEPGHIGPRRVSADELLESFATGWHCQWLESAFYEVRPDIPDFQFSGGKAHAWFADFRRIR